MLRRACSLSVLSAFLLLVIVTHIVPCQAGSPVGWRTDGSGKYPDATPPRQWSPETNVVWKQEVPSWSNSTPAVLDDRLFVGSEPTTLLCLSTSDGKILWQATHDYGDLYEGTKAREVAEKIAKAKELGDKWEAARRQVKKLEKDVRRLKSDPNSSKQEIQQAEKSLVTAKMDEDAIRDLVKPYRQWEMPRTHGGNGYSTPTPVTDGKSVWALFGNGVASCHGIDGQRRWIRLVDQPTRGWGHSASPLLAAGKLLVHIKDLVALDPASGKELWRAKVRPSWGTPVHAKIDGVDVAITPSGDVVRLADGEILASRISKLDYAAPIVEGDMAYFLQNKGKALKLSISDDGEFSTEELWQTEPKRDRYYASGVLHEGMLYCITQKGLFSAIDASNGKIVYEKQPDLGRGKIYPSIVLAGELLLVSSEGGTMVLIQPGREYKAVGKNQLESTRSTPVFHDGRMYVRGKKHVYCIAKTETASADGE